MISLSLYLWVLLGSIVLVITVIICNKRTVVIVIVIFCDNIIIKSVI